MMFFGNVKFFARFWITEEMLQFDYVLVAKRFKEILPHLKRFTHVYVSLVPSQVGVGEKITSIHRFIAILSPMILDGFWEFQNRFEA